MFFRWFLYGALAGCLRASAAQQPAPEDPLISTNADLVVLEVSVRDAHGGYVSGLKEDQFQISENKEPQKISYFSPGDEPVTIGIVVDNSGSMRRKRPDVVTAALTFVRASNPKDEAFVVTFNDKVYHGLPEDIDFTANQDVLWNALWRGKSEGMTALYDAIDYSLTYVSKGKLDRKALIVVSDGGDNTSEVSLNRVLDRLSETQATVYTVGVFDSDDPDRNPSVLRKLASISGGEYYQTSDLKGVVPVCKKIARDIRNRYTIAYVPQRSDSQRIRNVEVRAAASSHGKLIVHTRTRYMLPGTSESTTLAVRHKAAER